MCEKKVFKASATRMNTIYFQITSRLEWLDWVRYSVTEYMFPPFWYNHNPNIQQEPFPKNYVADNAQSKVLAMSRLRQLRVKPSKLIFFNKEFHLLCFEIVFFLMKMKDREFWGT